MADQPDELMDLTDLPSFPLRSNIIIEAQDAVASTSMFSYDVIKNALEKSRKFLANFGYFLHSLSIMCRYELDGHSGNRLSKLQLF